MARILEIIIFTMVDGSQAFHPNGRNKRTVWEIPLESLDTHFAVYPEKLVENCLLASTRFNDFVLGPFRWFGNDWRRSMDIIVNLLGLNCSKKYQTMAQMRIEEMTIQSNLFSSANVPNPRKHYRVDSSKAEP